MSEYKAELPTTLVIFGASGNLATTKLFPALYELLHHDHLPDDFHIVAVFRGSSTPLESIMAKVEQQMVNIGDDVSKRLMKRLESMITPIVMDSTCQEDHYKLRDLLDKIDADSDASHQRVFYLAIPPNIFPSVVTCLAGAGQHKEPGGVARRIFVEKPFGTDYDSAKKLIDHMAQYYKESQIYRIDHYLAKENAQNILTFRFMNPLIKDVWRRENIALIHVRALESIGIEGRGEFYDPLGALRDLIQSHLLQLMALVTLDEPKRHDSAALHAAKLKLLQSVRVVSPGKSTRGQYTGYRQEAKRPGSETETYARLELAIDNPKWRGVPIVLESGKALDRKETSIDVVFQDCQGGECADNLLTIRLQPDEGITLRLAAKRPGFGLETEPVEMKFDYKSTFKLSSPEAYERVFYDAIVGDQTLFASSAEVLECWQIIQPVISSWRRSGAKSLQRYAKGSNPTSIR